MNPRLQEEKITQLAVGAATPSSRSYCESSSFGGGAIVYGCVHGYMYCVCMHVFMCVCECVYVCMCAHLCVDVCVYAYVLYVGVHGCSWLYMCVHVCLYMRVLYMYIFVCVHVCRHTCIPCPRGA
jgi:hypothetical protein